MQRAEELLPVAEGQPVWQTKTHSNTIPIYPLPHESSSICPDCSRTIPSLIYEKDEKIWLTKTCPDHGITDELYFGSAKMFKRFAKSFTDGHGISNPNVPLNSCNCPKNCGLCSSHLSHSGLANIVLTNRCDLTCWYCFFYAKKGVEGAYVYEPSLQQIHEMVKTLRAQRPIPGNSIQLTGGEPTLRQELPEIIKICKDEGVDHIQLNSNAINMAIDPALVMRMKDAGLSSVYMSFDGTTPRTNGKNHWEAPYAIENCRKAGVGVVLVPTVIKSVNDQEVGSILRFAQANIDIVRAVNYQPVSLTGRLSKTEREKYRITIPDVIQIIEKQTNGEITEDDWMTVPSCVGISNFIEALTKKPQYNLSIHFACGAGCYAFKNGDKLTPLTRFVDVEGLLEFLEEKTDELNAGSSRLIVVPKILAKLGSFIDNKKAPEGLNLSKILFNVLVKHDYSSMGTLQNKSMFLGMMHFQDKYNHDEERLMRCDIHYVTPDQRIIPFCSFNVIPEWYRDRIQQKYGIPIEEWETKNGRTIEQGLYRGNLRKGKGHHAGCGCSVIAQQTQQARNMETITGDILPIISS